jgi:NNP family nitrate/nitrite transporter-like MFS transporter
MFLVGVSTGFYLPSGIASVTRLVDTRQWGKALAIHETAPNLSFLSVPFVAEILFIWVSWRGVFATIGIMSLIAGGIYALYGRGGEFKGETPHYASVMSLFRHSSFLMMIFLMSLGIASTVGVFTMLPLYLTKECEFAREQANTVIGFSRVLPLILLYVGGWAIDRFGAAQVIKLTLLVTGTLTIFLGIVPSYMVSVVVFLQPVVAVWFFPASFALLSSIVPAEYRSLSISFATPIAFVVGAGLFPACIGVMADMGLFSFAMSLVGACILSGGVMLVFKRL